jgi:hypothetical protein
MQVKHYDVLSDGLDFNFQTALKKVKPVFAPQSH